MKDRNNDINEIFMQINHKQTGLLINISKKEKTYFNFKFQYISILFYPNQNSDKKKEDLYTGFRLLFPVL